MVHSPPSTANRVPLFSLQIERTGEILANRAHIARSLRERLVGLLDRSALPEGEGLVLLACHSIHTVCMRFAIDAVFVDGRWNVLRICNAMPPWRISPIVWGAKAVVELPAGAAGHAQLEAGDRLVLQPVSSQNPLDRT